MSQAKVTDFFATRKRARQDDILLNKDKKPKTNIEQQQNAPSTRSRTSAKQKQNQENVPCEPEKPTVEAAPVQLKAVNTKQKVSVDELKQRIQNFNNKLQKHKEKYADSDEARKTISDIQQKESEPAYEKYHNLASKEYETSLVLPVKFQSLYEMFKGSDTIVKFMHNRQEICTFHKLKTSVQNITKKNFTPANLGQIKQIYSNAYYFKQEKVFADMKNDYHLIIAANLEAANVPLNENGVKLITPMVLLERLQKFKNLLYEIVKECHQKFLKSMGVQLDNKEIKRWHVKFDLESVEDIATAELPQPPNEVKCKNAEDIRQIAQEIYSCKVKNAIEQFSERDLDQTKADPNEKQTQTINKLTANYDAKRLKNFNALLEKVRAKEHQKGLENMVTNNDKERRLVKLDRYVECAKFLKSYYQAEKKCTIDIELICAKMFDSLRGRIQAASECEELIRSMCTDFVGWISIVKLRNIEYVKLNKATELSGILGKIETMKKETN